jgi:L-fuconolactonase
VVIDAHLHLWNTERLRYDWLQRPENAAINRTFGFGDFRSRATAAGVDRAVLVQADDSAADQLPPAGRDAVLGGTATRFYALGTPAGDAREPGR